MTNTHRCAAALAALLTTTLGWADSLSPASFSSTIGVGESVTVHKTLTISAGGPSSALVDIMFLFDSTGSMGGVISAAKSAANTILTNTSSLGDVRFGVADYKDRFDSYLYREVSDITAGANAAANQTATINAINSLFASGGGDTPEGNLIALQQLASDTAWRAGSTRIAVWLGDAPGHEGGSFYPGRADVLADLDAEGIIVNSISYTAGGGLDAFADGFTGQATYFTSNTGGIAINAGTSSTDAATITAAIQDAIDASFASYTSVSLDLSEVPAGLTAVVTPGEYTGSYDRSVDRTFEFDVTFTGDVAGDYSFNVYGVVGRGRVATEADRIRVGEGGPGPITPVPEPSTYGLIGAAALLGLVAHRRYTGQKTAA